jgi:Yip1 domain
MKSLLGINPWFRMWIKPRDTIRKIVDFDPNYRLYFLSAIYGFVSLLGTSQGLALGRFWNLLLVLIFCLVLSPIWGYIVFSISSFFIHICGKWIKGKGSYKEVRSAIAWSNVPMIVNVFLWIIMIVIFQQDVINEFPGEIVISQSQRAFLVFTFAVQIIVSIWILVLYIISLSEVQKFSIGKAILNILIAFVIFVVIFFVLSLIFFLIMKSMHAR